MPNIHCTTQLQLQVRVMEPSSGDEPVITTIANEHAYALGHGDPDSVNS